MARITKEEWDENKSFYDQTIISEFIKFGEDGVTYHNISAIVGIRKSTLQGYYKFKEDMVQVLRDRFFPEIFSNLKTESIDSFYNSLMSTLNHETHYNFWKLLVKTELYSKGGTTEFKRLHREMTKLSDSEIARRYLSAMISSIVLGTAVNP